MCVDSNNVCFVLMPFSKEFKNQWEFALIPAIESIGLKAIRADEDGFGTNIIMRDITKCISGANLIIADLTNKNPNVMYELGLAHSAKKPVIIITQNEKDVPFDVQHIRYLKYDPMDLKSLKDQLLERIGSTLNQNENETPDFFPELILMKEEDITELNYLRQKTLPVKIETYPPTADIFFNDQLMGRGSVTIYVNPNAPKNTISCAAIEYFEHYQEISKEEMHIGELYVNLEIRDKEKINNLLPRYLRLRRKDPDNPVLMRAITQYLFQIGEIDEAFSESSELLNVMGNWNLSHYLRAQLLTEIGEYEEAKKHYNYCIALRPDDVIGYIGLVGISSLSGNYQDAIDQLRNIIEDESFSKSLKYLGNWKFETDPDFEPIKKSHEFSEIFYDIIEKI